MAEHGGEEGQELLHFIGMLIASDCPQVFYIIVYFTASLFDFTIRFIILFILRVISFIYLCVLFKNSKGEKGQELLRFGMLIASDCPQVFEFIFVSYSNHFTQFTQFYTIILLNFFNVDCPFSFWRDHMCALIEDRCAIPQCIEHQTWCQ